VVVVVFVVVVTGIVVVVRRVVVVCRVVVVRRVVVRFVVFLVFLPLTVAFVVGLSVAGFFSGFFFEVLCAAIKTVAGFFTEFMVPLLATAARGRILTFTFTFTFRPPLTVSDLIGSLCSSSVFIERVFLDLLSDSSDLLKPFIFLLNSSWDISEYLLRPNLYDALEAPLFSNLLWVVICLKLTAKSAFRAASSSGVAYFFPYVTYSKIVKIDLIPQKFSFFES
jgi:hypothetical protein